jgi:hypothetical protein
MNRSGIHVPAEITEQAVTDRLRARTLRWLLKVARVNGLPMPKYVEFGEFDIFDGTRRYLDLRLDQDTEVTGWAKAIDADNITELDVVGDTDMWTLVSACTKWREGPRVDWHHIEVSAHHNRRPIPDDPTHPPAVTA